MFNLSFTELLLTMIIAVTILGPKDSIQCAITMKKIFAHMQSAYKRYIAYIVHELDLDDVNCQQHTQYTGSVECVHSHSASVTKKHITKCRKNNLDVSDFVTSNSTKYSTVSSIKKYPAPQKGRRKNHIISKH